MPATKHEPIGHGKIVWLGVNLEPGTFSQPRDYIDVLSYGVKDDMYYGEQYISKGHDVDYEATDGMPRGTKCENARQLTITDADGYARANAKLPFYCEFGMMRENMVVDVNLIHSWANFSNLDPASRLVFPGKTPKILLTTEKNEPCSTSCRPIARHFNRTDLGDDVRDAWRGNRGQMLRVKTLNQRRLRVGDRFNIFSHM